MLETTMLITTHPKRLVNKCRQDNVSSSFDALRTTINSWFIVFVEFVIYLLYLLTPYDY